MKFNIGDRVLLGAEIGVAKSHECYLGFVGKLIGQSDDWDIVEYDIMNPDIASVVGFTTGFIKPYVETTKEVTMQDLEDLYGCKVKVIK